MSKRDILRAAKRKGLCVESADWEWTITPEERIPCWSIYVAEDSADRFGIDEFHQFDNTAQVLEWIDELEDEEAHAALTAALGASDGNG